MDYRKAGVVTGLILISLAGGFVAGRFYPADSGQRGRELFRNGPMHEIRNKGVYRFINPLLECDESKPSLRPAIRQLEHDLTNYVKEAKTRLSISHVSYYYRDMNNGAWMGADVNMAFAPASLLKVPILIAALKMAERDRSLLDRRFIFDSSVLRDHIDPNIVDEQIRFGQSYTLRELMERMIVNSDNNAKNMIMTIVGEDNLNRLWHDLGVPVPGLDSPEDFLTIKDYSSFFRILFNATYLSRDMSEMALDIMSRTRFDSGLSRGVPSNVQVSNKFGERGFPGSDVKQLHDCGIVYAGDSPYLICVMTRGVNWQQQAELIAEISRQVYTAHTAVAPAH